MESPLQVQTFSADIDMNNRWVTNSLSNPKML